MFIALLVVSKITARIVRRKRDDRPLVENHMLKLRPPTWRFQKYHPNKCQHLNGIYRKSTVGDSVIEFFVCADCVDIIEAIKLKK